MVRVVAMIAVVFATGCKSSNDRDGRARVAEVDGMPIYLDEFRAQFKRLRLDDEEGAPSIVSDQTQKQALLDNLVERRLLLREAERTNTLVSIDEVDSAYERARSGWKEDEFTELLQKKDLTAAELKQQLRELLMIRGYLREHIYSRVAVTDEEIEAYIKEHKDMLTVPEQVRARHIVVSTKEKAEEIHAELRRGTDFEELAMKHSLGPEGKNGGDLGFFARGTMPALFDEVCFSLWRNQTSDVVESDYGFHVFKVIDKRPASYRPINEVREEVENILRQKHEREAQRRKVAELKKAADIDVHEKILARVN